MSIQPLQPQPQAPGAIAALVLGIIGITFCPVLSPFAWYYGRRAERAVDASAGMLGGRGVATAGKILGIVMTIIMGLLSIGVLIGVAVSGPEFLYE